MLQSFLFTIKDHRRAQGKRYQQGHILLFAVLGILSGATSYRKIERFIVGNYEKLDSEFQLGWKRMPAYTTIRDIIQRTSGEELERCFREYSASLQTAERESVQATDSSATSKQFIACDGKVLRGSLNRFQDQKAVQILSAFLTDSKLILAHQEIKVKSNEIPAAQVMIKQLGLSGYIYTLDAIHCQKNAGRS